MGILELQGQVKAGITCLWLAAPTESNTLNKCTHQQTLHLHCILMVLHFRLT